MSLKKDFLDATKIAMKEKNKAKLTVLRGFSAAVKQQEVDTQTELTDTEQLAVLDKLIKQRKDSEQQFREAGRDDLAETEAFEISILTQFLPKQLSDTEIADIITAAISEAGATNMSDMGAVMSYVKPRVQGRADMAAVSTLVKQSL